MFISEYLNEVLVQRCCLGCNSLKYVSNMTYYSKFLHNFFEKKADILLPVEFRGEDQYMFGHTAVGIFRHRSIYYLGYTTKVDTLKLVANLVNSALETWPLFVTAISMAMCAGVVIWVLVSVIILKSYCFSSLNQNWDVIFNKF